ncbi:MAG: DUF362 domain-containing protein [Candidatus Eisenbacteria bacterium]|jgi:hypothetical protein|nr:DUF362 domain-containing protein [Candidatus Eisenbacteria bacterium]
MSTVWFTPATADTPEHCQKSMRTLLHAAGAATAFRRGDLVAIKVHVGETAKRPFLGRELAAVAAREAASAGAHPFFTDTCVLYKSRRDDAVNHVTLAHEHGYSIEEAGAPFIVADGLRGTDEELISVPACGPHPVAVAGMARRADFFVVLAHATGHLGTGFGGVMKSLGMGLSSRKGKLSMHSVSKPFIRKSTCIACGECAKWCPADAITVAAVASIDVAACTGCGECLAMCRVGAVGFDWKASSASLQERIADHALAVVSGRQDRFLHVSIALRVTKDCDCLDDPGPPLFPDIGILASQDPVAVDQATLDLIRDRTGRPLPAWSYPQIDPTHQLARGEAIGLGSRSYLLTTVA